MMKMLVVALAMVAFAGQAHAIPEGKDRARDAKEKEMREQRKGAEKFAHGAAEGVNHVLVGKINASAAGKSLNGNESHDIAKAVNDPLLNKTAESALQTEALATKAQAAGDRKKADTLNRLAGLRMRGVAKLGNVDASLRNLDKPAGAMDFEGQGKQAFMSLIVGAGKEAMNWPEATTGNVADVTEVAIKALDSGKSYAEAMDMALKELKRLTKNDKLTLEDLKRLCKV